jgi:hypothetical protein
MVNSLSSFHNNKNLVPKKMSYMTNNVFRVLSSLDVMLEAN